MAGPTFPDLTFRALRAVLFNVPTQKRLMVPPPSQHRSRYLMLCGSLRERSYCRRLTFEAARLLEAMGAEVRIFDPSGLPLPGGAPDSHPKVTTRYQPFAKVAFWPKAAKLALKRIEGRS